MKDVLENELQVGDKVLCSTNGAYLEKAIITHIINNIQAHVKYISGNTAKNKRSYQILKIEW